MLFIRYLEARYVPSLPVARPGHPGEVPSIAVVHMSLAQWMQEIHCYLSVSTYL